jgi:DNA primase
MRINEVKALNPASHYYPANLAGQFKKVSHGEWWAWNGLCPFHNDRRPGSVYINLATGAFKCFSCGTSASDVLDFHCKLNNLTLQEAFRALECSHE